MRFLVDTNVLVSATFAELPGHDESVTFVARVLASMEPWCLAWVVVYEYLRVVTHPQVFARPLSWADAIRQAHRLLEHPSLQVLAETERHVAVLDAVVRDAGGASGNFVHDCHIAALMAEHDARRIVTYDSHFRRFPGIEVVKPGAS